MHAREELPGKKAESEGRTPRPSVAAPGGAARGPMTPAAVIALQRTVGNLAASRVLAEDQHVHGADCGHGTVGDSGTASKRELVEAAMSSPGRPLAGPMRAELESYYQNDFSAARIHDNPIAQRATAAMGAEAMTVGTHVFLGAGATARKDVIGHEFGHVNENLKGVPEIGSDNGAGVTVTDPNQGSERTAAADGAAFAAGAQTAPSVTAQRAAAAGAGQILPRAVRVGMEDAVPVQRAYGTATAYGTAASVRPRRQRRTKVEDLDDYLRDPEHKPAHPGAAGGARSTAILGPRSYFNKNSDANPALPRAKRDAEKYYKMKFISGHLLNAKFGGDGEDANNLTILTSSANSAMKAFDNAIIYAVDVLRSVYQDLSYLYVPIEDLDYGIYVKIEPSGSSYAWSGHYPGNCISRFINCQAVIMGEDKVASHLANFAASGDPHVVREARDIRHKISRVRQYVRAANERDLIDNE